MGIGRPRAVRTLGRSTSQDRDDPNDILILLHAEPLLETMKRSDSGARYRNDQAKNLVGFLVGDVRYAVDIHLVSEIVNPLPLGAAAARSGRRSSASSDHRGDVLPIVDLRVRFGLHGGGRHAAHQVDHRACARTASSRWRWWSTP